MTANIFLSVEKGEEEKAHLRFFLFPLFDQTIHEPVIPNLSGGTVRRLDR
jgi:hypothetical protein